MVCTMCVGDAISSDILECYYNSDCFSFTTDDSIDTDLLSHVDNIWLPSQWHRGDIH